MTFNKISVIDQRRNLLLQIAVIDLTYIAVKHMRKDGGTIINISSGAGEHYNKHGYTFQQGEFVKNHTQKIGFEPRLLDHTALETCMIPLK